MPYQTFTRELNVGGISICFSDITLLEKKGACHVTRLPFSIKILVENLLRNLDGRIVKETDLLNIANWKKQYDEPVEIAYHPARVLMQDFTGVPAVVDLAAMRDAVKDMGGDPLRINPLVPVDLVIDHSVQIDYFGTEDSPDKNVAKEFKRNEERYALLKWARKSFKNFRVVPPNSGICHQVNLEYLCRIIMTQEIGGKTFAFPDTLIGTDSHTTMINGIGIMGWGVGGIEAEAVMMGQPYYMSIPQVIGVKLVGQLSEGVTATDLVLTITEFLRKQNVVEKFVEYFGPGMKNLTIPERATIANMSPEYGATLGFFPVDEKTVDYLRFTHREKQAELVDAYTKAMGLFYTGEHEATYTKVHEFDLSGVVPSAAGPARPQDRIILRDLKKIRSNIRPQPRKGGIDAADAKTNQITITINGKSVQIGHGNIVVAAITSCTNTSNPNMMIGAGLLAKNAVSRGLKVPYFVKTSLAPGSKVVMRYLESAGLIPYLEALGFHLAGFGCTTCIGNSGPLHPEIEKAISENNLTVAAILSGNRNFEARIHQRIKANFLASPLLVVAFALAGRIDLDLTVDPVGINPNGEPVYLSDIWPTNKEIEDLVQSVVKEGFFAETYKRIFQGDTLWQQLQVPESTTFKWDEASTYIKKPPYFENFGLEVTPPSEINDARVLVSLGDSVTTDHISPAGSIDRTYPAGRYLLEKSIPPEAFNSYGSRRGNHEVMIRGTFGNIRIKNRFVSPKEGGFTLKFPDKEEMFIYDAAAIYSTESRPLIVLGGSEYGTGSSRDWAAKGTTLLGVRAVIATSFERIHRSNLVGMGVLPLVFKPGNDLENTGLTGAEKFYISGIENMKPRKVLHVRAVSEHGREIHFEVIARLDTEVEVDYYENGGILQYVLRKILRES